MIVCPAMAETTSDFLVHRLHEWGVHRIYGNPGDGINGILGALERSGDGMRFIQVRHEEMAAFMGDPARGAMLKNSMKEMFAAMRKG